MERDIPEADPRNMDNDELIQWARMGDKSCADEMQRRQNNALQNSVEVHKEFMRAMGLDEKYETQLLDSRHGV